MTRWAVCGILAVIIRADVDCTAPPFSAQRMARSPGPWDIGGTTPGPTRYRAADGATLARDRPDALRCCETPHLAWRTTTVGSEVRTVATPDRWWTVIAAIAAPENCQPHPRSVADALALYERRQYAEAKIAIAPLANGDDRVAALVLGRILLALGDHDGAISTLGVLARDKGTTDEHLWLARAYGARAQAVNVFLAARAAVAAKREWLRALALDAGNLDARSDLIRFYVTAPGVIGGSDVEAARHIADLRSRDQARGAIEAGRLARQRGRRLEAKREFDAAVAAPPGGADANSELIGLYVDQKDWPGAFAAVAAWRRAAPGSVEAAYQLGRVAALSGQRLDEGWAALSDYLAQPEARLRPTHASAHVRRAEIARHRGDTTGATAEVSAALRLEPGHAAALALRRSLAR